jgi:hypothetical protein
MSTLAVPLSEGNILFTLSSLVLSVIRALPFSQKEFKQQQQDNNEAIKTYFFILKSAKPVLMIESFY